ncbi:hypothetical protein WICPIJ_005459 [Wickerhamomyces pijperi]|uniref:2'-phosphotransferase n=1 Tax=Wickerhamomyces pijperi TaxID=599730 RepID=A0A9P8Q3G8_WICPI|nr:hypothetical protein WICPIJ_005459 [Wickerhamomyces pijperi]
MSDPAKRDILISKALSYLLRHGAVKERLPIDKNGFISISTILQNNRLKTHKTTVQDIHRIVETNEKKRFTIKVINDREHICANQGHSLKTVKQDDQILTPLTEDDSFPEQLIHGTTHAKLKLILQSGGLSKMNRNHIHFTSILENQGVEVSGLRSFSTVLIFLDLEKIKRDKDTVKFYKSLNNVYLTGGDANGVLSKEYFGKIIDRKTGIAIQ